MMNEKDLVLPMHRKEPDMLYTIAVILIILWLLGFITGSVGMGGFIHILLVIAVILIVVSLLTGNTRV